ncbi:MAG: glycoside hydrolase [Saprospiraceae bacterium]|nr:glycoside hydrolase [Saprospiraceae bacterium]MCF8249386.1 glycoside hydrolase [Saprospiraceae bacterium]MCF8279040.1 glycoside hydrolase [Bacteroidales bacterium]MCF8311515.1 glycoside hydrolase [Saprospiraceae bacterium]MCF8440005.1 glycoside hydrolase [Saprospiraceae bacterium]
METVSLKKLFFSHFLLLLSLSISAQPDPRHLQSGHEIFTNGYIDQPYIVTLPDSTWLCTFTTGKLEEGLDGQHIAASRSADQGQNWTTPVPIEPAAGPAASWAMPYLTSFGRVYVFYSYNGDEVSELKGEKLPRNDMLGWYCFKFSDDGGLTWSERHRLPMRLTACDFTNDWQGKVQIFWGIGKPVTVGKGMMLGFTKIGKYMLDKGEGWFFRCENINAERDPNRLKWQMLPDGENGVGNPDFGSVQEEHSVVAMSDGGLCCIYRTQTGYLAESYSHDGGHHWTLPKQAQYLDGHPVKNPRACPKAWRCTNGKYLLWYHNHSGDHFSSRNPAWLAAGKEVAGEIRWSQPELVLYDLDHSYETGRFSYPDLVEQNGRFWLTETNKFKASIHPVPIELVEGLWRQLDDPSRPPSTLSRPPAMSFPEDSLKSEKLPISGFPKNSAGGYVFYNAMLDTGGFTIEMTVQPRDFSPNRVLLDTRNETGSGFYIQTTGYRQLELTLCNTETCETWATDSGLLDIVRPHKVTFIVDNGPDIILAVVDGQLCDGGISRQYGWEFYSPFLGQVLTNRKKEIRILPEEMKLLKLYDRVLSVSEAVENQRIK